jgi:hypothetical protein
MTVHAPRSGTAMVICGSLVRPVEQICRERGWNVDFHGLPAAYHLHPERLLAAIEDKLTELQGRYERTLVVYGDCGTAGGLDHLLARFGAEHPAGLHCYEMLAGRRFHQIMQERPGTYFVTPWMVRHFEGVILRDLGLDRHPELTSDYFGNYTDLAYLREAPDPDLDRRAAEIAKLLGLRLEIYTTGLNELGRRLATVVEREPERSQPWNCRN